MIPKHAEFARPLNLSEIRSASPLHAFCPSKPCGPSVHAPALIRHDPTKQVVACFRQACSRRGSVQVCAAQKAPHKTDSEADNITPIQPTSAPSPFLLSMALGAVAVAIYGINQAGGVENVAQAVEELAKASGDLGPLVFGTAYVAATVLLVPGSVLTLAAGYLFGPLFGTAVVSASSTAGAAAAFLISRYLARPFVKERLAGVPKLDAIGAAVARDGARIVLLLRLSPLVPFTLLNYGLGLTEVGFVEYVGASWLGMLPGTFAYVYLGGAGKVAVDAASSSMAAAGASGGGDLDAAKIALYVVGAIATLLATRFISKAASAALEDS